MGVGTIVVLHRRYPIFLGKQHLRDAVYQNGSA
jgi:hypothetical protein